MISIPVDVKEALKEGSVLKEYKFEVLDDSGAVVDIINNDNLVSESVKIDERMCSGKTIKFGLCEGSSLEFQYFNKPSILGKEIKASIVVKMQRDQQVAETNDTIPMGFFTVDEISRQASTGIMKVTAYNKLRSSYLDAKANQIITEYIASLSTQRASIFNILKHLLGEFKIRNNRGEPVNATYSLAGDNVWLDRENPSFWDAGFDADVLKITITPENYNASKYYSYQIPTAALTQMIADVIGPYMDVRIMGNYDGSSVGFVSFRDVLYGSNYLVTPEHPEYIILTYITGCTNIGLTRNINPRSMSRNNVAQWAENNYQISAYYDKESYTTDVTNEPLIIYIPVIMNPDESGSSGSWRPNAALLQSLYDSKIAPTGGIGAEIVASSPLDSYEITLNQSEAFSDITLRELQSADYEVGCLFGQLDRELDGFYGVALNHSRLFPSDTIYPTNSRYPDGGQNSAMRSMYSKLWADEGNVQSFRNLIITYKGLDENQREKDYILQRTVNANGTQDYNCSDNWLFRNLVWTADQIGAYADAMVANMRDVYWFPFEMWCAGLPYLETGDEIEIPIGENVYTSYILQRTLSGIQNLQDTYINGELDIF